MRERIAALDALQRKYGTGEEEVLAFLARAAESLDVLAGVEQARERAALEMSERVERVTALATAVSDGRDRAMPQLTTALQEELRELGMEGATIEVTLVPNAELLSTGAEHAEFVFSGGPSQPAQPLAKVASGGELSRTMLACRSVLVDLDDVPTLIFDEVDAGIGGRAGVAVGRRLANLALGRQVVVVTHLPQIASFADRHIRVRKDGRDRLGRGAGRRGARGGALADARRSSRQRCGGRPRRGAADRGRPREQANGLPSTARRLPGCPGAPNGVSDTLSRARAAASASRALATGPNARPSRGSTREAPTFGTKPRSLLRRPLRRPKPQAGVARVDARTKRLVQRVQPGEIAVIDHEDLDGVSAEALVAAGVGGVVNAARSISGRYPNLGPIRLLEAGIPLVDAVGPAPARQGARGRPAPARRRTGSTRATASSASGSGRARPRSARSMGEAQLRLAERFESFARNTVDYMQRERDLLFGGSGLPALEHDLADRPVLVVVRGYNYKEDLAVLRPYIRDVRPVLLGVDGGADALIEAGLHARPDPRRHGQRLGRGALVRAAPLRGGGSGGGSRPSWSCTPTRTGTRPGRERLEALGVPFRVVEAAGTSEDVAFLLAHEKGAETIVAVGSHGNLREFLDKGREGMSSTFLVRLRVGEILMDAKGVSRVYSPRIRTRDAVLLVGAPRSSRSPRWWRSRRRSACTSSSSSNSSASGCST